MTQLDLATLIRNFFEQYLVSQRGLSSHTVVAYRDTWKLLLQFASRFHRKTCVTLALADLKADTVRRFLDYLERERHNGVATRNSRLAAIHAFFEYVAQMEPRYLPPLPIDPRCSVQALCAPRAGISGAAGSLENL